MNKVTKADLDAANAEVRDLTNKLKIVSEGQNREARIVEEEYAVMVANLAMIVRHTADLAANLARKIAKPK